MKRLFSLLTITIVCIFGLSAGPRVVVADSVTQMPLSGASVFDSSGKAVGMCDSRGRIPYASSLSYPLTVRYLGFKERVVDADCRDTVFLHENFAELPELTVESRQHKLLHMLGFVREYSTLATYTDTVFLFREKMVDYMLPADAKVRMRGWRDPRVLKAKSYYRFTNAQGLDSVSDRCNNHFSWSDWIGIPPDRDIPPTLFAHGAITDTVAGRYGVSELWTRNGDRAIIDIDVLADTASRRWVPNLSSFFRKSLDFENFRVRFNYDNIVGEAVSPLFLNGYTYTIESAGRGRDMFMFNKVDQQVFVSTYAEVYILDKEYVTVKEARKWERHKFDTADMEIMEPDEAPELQPSIRALVALVEALDHDGVRLDFVPDERLASFTSSDRNFKIGRRALFMLKQLTGISAIRSHRNANRSWREFRRSLRQNSENDVQK